MVRRGHIRGPVFSFDILVHPEVCTAYYTAYVLPYLQHITGRSVCPFFSILWPIRTAATCVVRSRAGLSRTRIHTYKKWWRLSATRNTRIHGLETARRDSRNAARLASDLRDTGRALAAQQDVHIYGHDTVGWFGHARLRRYRWAAAAFMGRR